MDVNVGEIEDLGDWSQHCTTRTKMHYFFGIEGAPYLCCLTLFSVDVDAVEVNLSEH